MGIYGLPDSSTWDGLDGAYVEDGGTVEGVTGWAYLDIVGLVG